MSQTSQDLRQRLVRNPTLKPPMAGLIRGIAPRQVRPRSSGAKDPQHAIKNIPRRAPRATALTARRSQFSTRNVRLYRVPLRVGEIHDMSRSKPRSPVDPVQKTIELHALGSRRVMRRGLVPELGCVDQTKPSPAQSHSVMIDINGTGMIIRWVGRQDAETPRSDRQRNRSAKKSLF